MSEQSHRLREARERAGFSTAAEAARHFGWAEVTYRAHEAGRGLRLSAIEQYATAFGVSPEWLSFGTGEGLRTIVGEEQQQTGGDASIRLREARERAGFSTAADAARRFSWPAPTYFQHEGGQRGLRPKIARRYAAAFGVSPEWLMFGAGSDQSEDAFGVLAAFLKAERQRMGLTQTELAQRAGVSQQVIADWETGKRKPRSDGAVKLAKALGIAVEQMPLVDGGTQHRSAVLEVPLDLDPDLLASWRAMDPVSRRKLAGIARILAGRGDT